MTRVTSEWDIDLDDALRRTLGMVATVIPIDSDLRALLELVDYAIDEGDVTHVLSDDLVKMAGDPLFDPVTMRSPYPHPVATPGQNRQRALYWLCQAIVLRHTLMKDRDVILEGQEGEALSAEFIAAISRSTLAAVALNPSLDIPEEGP